MRREHHLEVRVPPQRVIVTAGTEDEAARKAREMVRERLGATRRFGMSVRAVRPGVYPVQRGYYADEPPPTKGAR